MMTFNSLEFIIFFPTVLLLWNVLPKKLRMPMLLAASYFFYMYFQPALVVLIFGTTLVSWLCSLIMERVEVKIMRRLVLGAVLLVSLGALFVFKYFAFFFESAAGVASFFFPKLSAPELNIILPVGISFYTFQTLSYVIDVYRRDIKCERNFFWYALFVSFFPQLVAGPIERPDNLLPQLKALPRWNSRSAILGAKFMLLGFFKKICVADMIAPYVNSIYNNPDEASSVGVILASVLFAIQIYCDFSGYTDIAIGCAEMMGIHLMKNFDKPYSSTTVTEFWSRWHISLSSWFRDYLYIPLGGNRHGKFRKLLNLAVVFIVSGLWHGAAWTFVIWGALHAVYRVSSELSLKPRNRLLEKMKLKPTSALVVWIRRINTFVLCTFAWLFFRANSISDAGVLISRLFSFERGIGETLSYMQLDAKAILLVVFSVVTLFAMDRLLVYRDEGGSSSALTKNGSYIYIIWCIGLIWLLLLSKDMISSFIYFQF